MITIPNTNRQYIQTNKSDILGNLYATFNCDFDRNVGNIALGKRLVINTRTSDVAEITSYPVGFRYFYNGTDSAYYTIAGASNVGYLFKGGSVLEPTGFSKVTTGASGTPIATVDSTTSDLETGFGNMYISSASEGKVYCLDSANAWTTLTAGSAGYFTALCYFPFQNRMYASKSGNLIQSWDSTNTPIVSPTNTYALTLPNGTIITWIRAASDRLWIGTVSQSGGKGFIYEWNGVDTQFTRSYRIEASGALACVVKDDIPYVIDSNGALLVWNGGTFVKLSSFRKRKNKVFFNSFSKTNYRFIHPNGMAIIQGQIHILADLTNYDASNHLGTQDDCNPSGVWVYDEDTRSLKHKYSFGLAKQSETITDYGQIRIYGAGALSEILTTQSSPVTTDGTFLAGCSYYTSATATSSGIFYDNNDDDLKKSGFFITSEINSANLQDAWNKVYVNHKDFLDTADRIVVKYRTEEDEPLEAVITWSSTTSFVTANSSAGDYEVGDEVQVVQGLGSGVSAHITNIQLADSASYIVTLDETFTGATGTSQVRFQKWKKAGTIQDTENFDELPLGVASSIIQLKLFMQWTGGNEFEKLTITNQPHRKYE